MKSALFWYSGNYELSLTQEDLRQYGHSYFTTHDHPVARWLHQASQFFFMAVQKICPIYPSLSAAQTRRRQGLSIDNPTCFICFVKHDPTRKVIHINSQFVNYNGNENRMTPCDKMMSTSGNTNFENIL